MITFTFFFHISHHYTSYARIRITKERKVRTIFNLLSPLDKSSYSDITFVYRWYDKETNSWNPIE